MAMASDNNSLTGNAVIVKCGISPDFFKTNINNKAQMKKLDTFVKEQKIETCHLIKINVEGAEVMFLRGAISFIGQHRPIIYREFNNYFLLQM
jgi:FkbM family methyltransferase